MSCQPSAGINTDVGNKCINFLLKILPKYSCHYELNYGYAKNQMTRDYTASGRYISKIIH